MSIFHKEVQLSIRFMKIDFMTIEACHHSRNMKIRVIMLPSRVRICNYYKKKSKEGELKQAGVQEKYVNR